MPFRLPRVSTKVLWFVKGELHLGNLFIMNYVRLTDGP